MSEPNACVECPETQLKHNKCILKPGRSLMDWIRLGLSSIDLSGTKGVIHPVCLEELAKHCREDDAWIALRGGVFNVTHYMEFHPGGIDELMRAVGKDATELFEEIHPWVNYVQILAKCYIGPLINDSSVRFNKSNMKNEAKNTSFLVPHIPHIEAEATVGKSQLLLSERKSTISGAQKLPYRFDWIQKLHETTLIFYTTSFSNPGIVLRYLTDRNLGLDMIFKDTVYEFSIKLFDMVSWPCLLKVYEESGKIEVICSKEREILWPNYGEFESKSKKTSGKVEYEFGKTHAKQISKNSFAISLQPKAKMIMYTGVGKYVRVTAKSLDNQMTRSYTPVPVTFTELESNQSEVCFLIKKYDTGNMSRFIVNEESRDFYLSEPKGDFPLSSLKDHRTIGLIAAGSGITPMFSIIQHLLRRSYNKVTCINLVYVNRTMEEIWCYEKLESEKLLDNRLHTKYLLTQPGESRHERFDHFSEDVLSTHFSAVEASPTFYCICGPEGFSGMALRMLQKRDSSYAEIYCFQ